MDWDLKAKKKAKIRMVAALIVSVAIAAYTWVNNDAFVLAFIKFISAAQTQQSSSTIKKFIAFIRGFPYLVLACGISSAQYTYHNFVGKNARKKYLESSEVDKLDLGIFLSQSIGKSKRDSVKKPE